MTPMLGIMASSISGSKAITGNYYSIATATVTSGGAASITFSSIPSTYTHLEIRMSNCLANANTVYYVSAFPNSDTASNYAYHRLYGNGTGAGSNANSSTTSGLMMYGGASKVLSTTTYPSNSVTQILDYTNTNKYKTSRSLYGQDANGSGEAGLASSVWMATTAVSSLLIQGYGNNLGAGTVISLYGVK